MEKKRQFKAKTTKETGRRVHQVDHDEEDKDRKEMMVLIFMFKTMIDTGSPVTTSALDEIKKIIKRKELQVRQMIEGETFDFEETQIDLVGYKI